jgi:hypothetical protein
MNDSKNIHDQKGDSNWKKYDVNQFEELSDQELFMLIEKDDEISDIY